jgi:hypothetical protein
MERQTARILMARITGFEGLQGLDQGGGFQQAQPGPGLLQGFFNRQQFTNDGQATI